MEVWWWWQEAQSPFRQKSHQQWTEEVDRASERRVLPEPTALHLTRRASEAEV